MQFRWVSYLPAYERDWGAAISDGDRLNYLGLESNGRAIWQRRVVGASDNVDGLATIDVVAGAVL